MRMAALSYVLSGFVGAYAAALDAGKGEGGSCCNAAVRGKGKG